MAGVGSLFPLVGRFPTSDAPLGCFRAGAEAGAVTWCVWGCDEVARTLHFPPCDDALSPGGGGGNLEKQKQKKDLFSFLFVLLFLLFALISSCLSEQMEGFDYAISDLFIVDYCSLMPFHA